MSDTDEPAAADHGPPDSYHPIYDSVVEWLDGERRAKPDEKVPARRQRRTLKQPETA